MRAIPYGVHWTLCETSTFHTRFDARYSCRWRGRRDMLGGTEAPHGRNRSVRLMACANAAEGAPPRMKAWRTWPVLWSASNGAMSGRRPHPAAGAHGIASRGTRGRRNRTEDFAMDVVCRIRTFNAGRDPERLQLKYRAMRGSAFAFLRGTCHLFYDRLPSGGVFKSAPRVWVCGDLHLENF